VTKEEAYRQGYNLAVCRATLENGIYGDGEFAMEWAGVMGGVEGLGFEEEMIWELSESSRGYKALALWET